MDSREKINQYDLVEIIQVPERLKGVIELGDIGTVVEKYDAKNFEIECVQPGGSFKWLETLNIKYVRLRSRDPYSSWVKNSLIKSMTQRSMILGAAIGAIFGALVGSGLGAITKNLNGILIGLLIGLFLGAVTGILTAALTVKIAGTTGGIGVGYFVGMVFGGIFGLIIGVLVPTSLRMSAHTEDLPVLDVLMIGRFETAATLSFLLSILATIVGLWISGKNLITEDFPNN